MIQALVNSLGNGTGLAIAAVGLFLIYRATRQFHFAYGSLFAASGIAAYALAEVGVPVWLAVAGGGAIGAILGVAVYWALYKPLPNELAVMLTSFGLSIVVVNVLVGIVGSTPLVTGYQPDVAVRTEVVTITWLDVAELATGVVVIAAVAYIEKRTPFGWSVRAVASDREVALLSAISPTRIFVAVYALGSASGGIAAGFEMLRVGASPFSGDAIVLILFMAVFIARGVSLAVTVISAFAIEMVLGLVAAVLDVRYEFLVLYGTLLVALVVAPVPQLLRASRVRRRLQTELAAGDPSGVN